MAAWTVAQPPEAMAEEVRQAAGRGYRWIKYHLDQSQNVLDQTEAMQEVAPRGFRIHYDFNGNRSLGAVLPIISELERNHPIVGYIEDPLVKSDIDSWCRLREQTRLPIIMHGTPLGGVQEMIRGVADIYMIEGGIGDTMATGFACGKANIQTILRVIIIYSVPLIHHFCFDLLISKDHSIWSFDSKIYKIQFYLSKTRIAKHTQKT